MGKSIAVLAVLMALMAGSPAVQARDLTFEERVEAQTAIERVYHSHRIATTLPFERAVPRSVIVEKVRHYLQQSAALERQGRPITAAALQVELERIAARSRFPERLQQIYRALGEDPLLVQECFARQHLVARLARGLEIDTPDAPYETMTTKTVASDSVALPVPTGLTVPCFPDDTWRRGTFDDLEVRDQHTALWTGTEMLIWGGQSGTALLATGHRYDPLADNWSPMSVTGAPTARARHVGAWTGTQMLVWGGWDGGYSATGGRYDPVGDSWTGMSTINAPAAREAHTAVWADDQMIVWGGVNGPLLDSGGRYDPASNTWILTNTVGAPSARRNHSAVWTGSRMIVWGGNDGSVTNTGGEYNPGNDTWESTSTSGAPVARRSHAAVWTGNRMVVWGGYDAGLSPLDSGGRYNPNSGGWQDTSTTNAPEARVSHTAVWTGDVMLVWGGIGSNGPLNSGGRYSPQGNTWTAISTQNAPIRRFGHTALWTGGEMIVWGGSISTRLRSGGRYDPVSDSWTATAPAAPESRSGHSGVWTGTHLVVWGGSNSNLGNQNTGGLYDPLVDMWTATSTAGAPSARSGHTAIWTGDRMVIWGGGGGEPNDPDTGGRYNPLIDSWAPMSTVDAPAGRHFHAAVWTGDRMVIWGGFPDKNSGGSYDPVSDSWQPTSTSGAPIGRYWHTAVWTGSRVVIWGGYRNPVFQNTGSVYDPANDTWSATSTLNAPDGRGLHTAVWTGGRMVVWGGNNLTIQGTGTRFDTGGLYNPNTDSWSQTSTVGVPTGRDTHSAIWTGQQMVVWGGQVGPPFAPFDVDTGGRYDPVADGWVATSTVDAPSARHYQTAVWTGSDMLVWGGINGGSNPHNWGKYALGHASDDDGDGVTECAGDCDDANATIYPGAPELCDNRDNDCDGALAPEEVDGDTDGSPFCADCDDADPTTYPGAPELCDTLDNDCDLVEDEFVTTCGLGECTAMGFCSAGVDSCTPGTPSAEVCDGLDNDCDGIVPAVELDDDGDGLTDCEGDCNDASEFTYPGAIEVNDGLDNQCAGEPGFGLTDEISGLAGFNNPGDPHAFCWPAQPFAVLYEASRSDAPDQPLGCVRSDAVATCWSDAAVPASGQAFFYLVRTNCQYLGSLGADSEGVERTWGCEHPSPFCPD